MASGFGVKAPVGRCYPVYMEFADCLSTEGNTKKCGDMREDYFECLHHTKEVARINSVMEEYTKRKKAGESLPPTLSQEMASGLASKVPFTKA